MSTQAQQFCSCQQNEPRTRSHKSPVTITATTLYRNSGSVRRGQARKKKCVGGTTACNFASKCEVYTTSKQFRSGHLNTRCITEPQTLDNDWPAAADSRVSSPSGSGKADYGTMTGQCEKCSQNWSSCLGPLSPLRATSPKLLHVTTLKHPHVADLHTTDCCNAQQQPQLLVSKAKHKQAVGFA